MTRLSLCCLEYFLLVKDQARSAASMDMKGRVRTVFELNTLRFEIFNQWKNNRIVLVERRTIDSFKGVYSRNFLNETVKISPKLDCTVPFLKSKPGNMSYPETDWQREFSLT